jgi:hypothetical protein
MESTLAGVFQSTADKCFVYGAKFCGNYISKVHSVAICRANQECVAKDTISF